MKERNPDNNLNYNVSFRRVSDADNILYGVSVPISRIAADLHCSIPRLIREINETDFEIERDGSLICPRSANKIRLNFRTISGRKPNQANWQGLGDMDKADEALLKDSEFLDDEFNIDDLVVPKEGTRRRRKLVEDVAD